MENTLEWSRRLLRTKKRDIKSLLNFLSVKYIHHKSEKIRVVFLIQYIPAWNKIEPVYKRLVSDTRFETFLLCVPAEIIENQLNPSVKSNETYHYFVEKGYDSVINAMVGSGKWYDLKSLKPDYVFYTRPYNNYLPLTYTSEKVSGYARICLILYGIMLTRNGLLTAFNKGFCSYVYAYFAENASAAQLYRSQQPFQSKLNLHNVTVTGPAALESITARKNNPAEAWNFSSNQFRVMWTPRWVIDTSTGEGTNFFKYKDFLTDFAQNNPDIDFLFRPHPLALDHFVSTGAMSPHEVSSFRKICQNAHNISLDESEEYVETFWKSSVLISDISSLLPEYLATGKPVIYCSTNTHLKPEPFAEKLLDSCYIAENSDDIRKLIQELKSGRDDLKEKRRQVMSEIFGEDFDSSSRKIVSFLLEDHAGHRSRK